MTILQKSFLEENTGFAVNIVKAMAHGQYNTIYVKCLDEIKK